MEAVLNLLEPAQLAVSRERIEVIRSERERLAAALRALPTVVKIWPSCANFILAEFSDAASALERARAAHLLVRDVRGQPGLGRCLRITVGSVDQNARLLEALR
jgi:histidinol-phosphate aminotransferase